MHVIIVERKAYFPYRNPGCLVVNNREFINKPELMVGGKRLNLRVGDAPASVGEQAGSKSSGSKIVLTAGDGGHFLAQGSINGKSVQFMVDTGATAVAMGSAEAKRMGIDYTPGKPVRMSTANGATIGYLLTLNSVRIGDVEVQNVEAIVSQQAMP